MLGPLGQIRCGFPHSFPVKVTASVQISETPTRMRRAIRGRGPIVRDPCEVAVATSGELAYLAENGIGLTARNRRLVAAHG